MEEEPDSRHEVAQIDWDVDSQGNTNLNIGKVSSFFIFVTKQYQLFVTKQYQELMSTSCYISS